MPDDSMMPGVQTSVRSSGTKMDYRIGTRLMMTAFLLILFTLINVAQSALNPGQTVDSTVYLATVILAVLGVVVVDLIALHEYSMHAFRSRPMHFNTPIAVAIVFITRCFFAALDALLLVGLGVLLIDSIGIGWRMLEAIAATIYLASLPICLFVVQRRLRNWSLAVVSFAVTMLAGVAVLWSSSVFESETSYLVYFIAGSSISFILCEVSTTQESIPEQQ